MSIKKYKSAKIVYTSYFVLFFLLSHVIFNYTQKDDFLMFFKWSMFSQTSTPKAYELKSRKRLLLRDNLISERWFRHKVYHNLANKNYDWIIRNKKKLEKFCLCNGITIIDTQMSIVDYFVYKKKLRKVRVLLEL